MSSRRAVLSLLLLICAGLAFAAQGLLTSLKFSNANGETVFRLLYAAAFVANLVLVVFWRPVGVRPTLQALLLLAPALLVVLMMLSVRMGHDAQGGIFMLILPVVHALLLAPAAMIAAEMRKTDAAA